MSIIIELHRGKRFKSPAGFCKCNFFASARSSSLHFAMNTSITYVYAIIDIGGADDMLPPMLLCRRCSLHMRFCSLRRIRISPECIYLTLKNCRNLFARLGQIEKHTHTHIQTDRQSAGTNWNKARNLVVKMRSFQFMHHYYLRWWWWRRQRRPTWRRAGGRRGSHTYRP